MADELARLYASSATLRTVSPHGKAPHVTFVRSIRSGGSGLVVDSVSVGNVSIAVLYKNLAKD